MDATVRLWLQANGLTLTEDFYDRLPVVSIRQFGYRVHLEPGQPRLSAHNLLIMESFDKEALNRWVSEMIEQKLIILDNRIIGGLSEEVLRADYPIFKGYYYTIKGVPFASPVAGIAGTFPGICRCDILTRMLLRYPERILGDKHVIWRHLFKRECKSDGVSELRQQGCCSKLIH